MPVPPNTDAASVPVEPHIASPVTSVTPLINRVHWAGVDGHGRIQVRGPGGQLTLDAVQANDLSNQLDAAVHLLIDGDLSKLD